MLGPLPWDVMEILASLSPDPVAVLQGEGVDGYRYVWLDPRVADRMGMATDALEGRLLSRVHSADFTMLFVQHAKIARSRNQPVRFELKTRLPVGERSLELTLSPLMGRTGDYLIVAMRDVSARGVEIEERRSSEERLRVLVERSPDTIWVIDERGLVRYVSSAVEQTLGFTPVELVDTWAPDILHDEDLGLIAELLQTIQNSPNEQAKAEVRCKRKDGSVSWFECTITNLLDDPRVRGVVINARDINERRRVEALMARNASQDALTGLPNRMLLDDRINAKLAEAEENGLVAAVVFVDLDGLKIVNDTLGYTVGDEVLAESARRLRATVGDQGWIARFGGDEFVVIAEPTDSTEAHEALGRHIREALNEPFDVHGTPIILGGSVGVALGSAADGDTADLLLRHADLAMYEAKRRRIGVCTFDQSLRRIADRRFELLTHLNAAVENEQFMIEYQPIVGLVDRRIVGVEALVRWNHPTLGPLLPNDFISVAEETGHIIEIGDWVFAQTCQNLAKWAERGLRVAGAVNVSPKQLTDPLFFDRITSTMSRSNVDPAQVILEITEDLIIDNPDHVRNVLQRLTAIGVRVAIDDFGRGYSSLAFLARFPAAVLKIDREFVNALRNAAEPGERTQFGADPYALVVAIVSMAHGLGMDLIAEGIEDMTELVALRSMGCRYGQGHLLGTPMPPEEIEAELFRPGRLGALSGRR